MSQIQFSSNWQRKSVEFVPLDQEQNLEDSTVPMDVYRRNKDKVLQIQ